MMVIELHGSLMNSLKRKGRRTGPCGTQEVDDDDDDDNSINT
jgi:hypothetical protein